MGEALVRTLRDAGREVVGLDILEAPFTTGVGSIADRSCVRRHMTGVQAVFHAATLHKPHVATHSRQDFIDTNITGTLNLLEEAVATGVGAFVFTSSTSVFGDALVPPPGAPAAWVTEEVRPIPKNIYWRHQGRGRGPLPAVPQEPGAGVRRPQNLAIFPGGRRQPGHA